MVPNIIIVLDLIIRLELVFVLARVLLFLKDKWEKK